MKRASLFPLLVIAMLLSLAGSGCQKTPKDVTPIPGMSTRASQPGPSGPMDGDDGSDIAGQVGGGEQPGGVSLPEGQGYELEGSRETFEGMVKNTNVFSEQTVYFDFDRSNVGVSEQAKVESVAQYLQDNPLTRLLIEGHCDARGTEEYNRALGERRALSLREYLINLGIQGDRIQTISYGEDRPAVSDASTESEHADNRRGEFVLLEQPNQGDGASG